MQVIYSHCNSINNLVVFFRKNTRRIFPNSTSVSTLNSIVISCGRHRYYSDSLNRHMQLRFESRQIMGTYHPYTGATFSIIPSMARAAVVSNCPPQAQAGNWQLYIHTTSIYYQRSQWVQILSEVKVCKLYCLSFPFIFHIETFFCRLNNVKNKIDRQTID